MLRIYQLKWFFILAASLTLSALLLQKELLNKVALWQILYFIVSVHIGMAVSWMSLGYVITRDFWTKRNIVFKHFLGIIISVIASFIVAYAMHCLLPRNPLDGKAVGFDTLQDSFTNISGMLLISLICYVVFYGAHTNSMLQNTRLEKERLEHAHLRAQLLSLQQQISPHFLFNSLGTLRTMVADEPVRNYIVQLSNVYRYVLKFNEHYLTPLNEELKFIKSYLYILNERFEESLFIEINIDPECLHLQLPPMSLQLLVENAIKHNISSPEQPLEIRIYNNELTSLTVQNNLKVKTRGVEQTGTGLKNITDRYKLIAELDVEVLKTADNFSVTIPLIEK